MSIVTPLSFTVIPFGAYQGQTFDQVPLGYLDWLAGQSWLWENSQFVKRLYRYLKRPCIQRELDVLFPDKDLEPSYFQAGPTPHPWHGYTMPKCEEARDWTPKPFRPIDAWSLIADLMCWMDDHNDPNDLLEMPFEYEDIKRAMKYLTSSQQAQVRTRFQSWRSSLRQIGFASSTNIQWWHDLLTSLTQLCV
jgi:hypothetical protein